ncbi:MAG: DNA primase [Chlamydiia bacterium]
MFSKESLDQLRQKVDLVEFLSAYIPLKRTGASYKTCCPFHEERSPSFTVQRGDRHYHCYGCGAHGDAITFLMQHQRIGFSDSVELLAQRYQVVLQREQQTGEEVPKKHFKEIMERAARLCHYCLLHSEEGRAPLQYLFQRGLDLNFIRSFGVGYWSNQGVMRKLLEQSGASTEDLHAVGLLTQQQHREFFRERITFPVRNPLGEVIGFSARKWREETHGGKYVNSPETVLFKKSHILFGLSYSRRRIARERQVILVEGQIDALSMIQAGLNITVATQGTAFADGHLRELQQLGVQQVWLCMDGDAAGREASWKIGDLLQSEGLGVRIVMLPSGQDPDQFLRTEGPYALLELMTQAPDYLSFMVGELQARQRLSDPASKTQAIGEMVARIREWKQPVMVHESLRKLAQLLHMPEHLMGVGAAPRAAPQAKKRPGLPEIDPDLALESDLLRWFLWLGNAHEPLLQAILKALPSDQLRHPRVRRIYEALQSLRSRGEQPDLLGIAAEIGEDELMPFLDQLLEKKLPIEKASQLLPMTVQKILERNWLARCEAIRIGLHSGEMTDEAAIQGAKQYGDLRRSPPLFQVSPDLLVMAPTGPRATG